MTIFFYKFYSEHIFFILTSLAVILPSWLKSQFLYIPLGPSALPYTIIISQSFKRKSKIKLYKITEILRVLSLVDSCV